MSYLENDCCRPNYLGFNVSSIGASLPIAAASGPGFPFVAAFMAATSVVSQIIPSIGAGRKEADAIGPEQRALGDALGQLDTILRTYVLGASDLQQLDTQLRSIWEQFRKFVYQEAFTADGDTRASDQAIATMQPQVEMRLATIMQNLNAILGRPNVPTTMQSGGPPALEFRTTSDLTLPQSGFFTAGAVSPRPPMATGPESMGVDSLLPKLAVAGVLAYLLMRR